MKTKKTTKHAKGAKKLNLSKVSGGSGLAMPAMPLDGVRLEGDASFKGGFTIKPVVGALSNANNLAEKATGSNLQDLGQALGRFNKK